MYEKLEDAGMVRIKSNRIRVGDVVQVNTNQRVPADMVILRTHDDEGGLFVRTD
jgi:phospholipid-translocating ATPase